MKSEIQKEEDFDHKKKEEKKHPYSFLCALRSLKRSVVKNFATSNNNINGRIIGPVTVQSPLDV